MDITPTPNAIKGIRENSSGTWAKMLSELIDNSMAAGATQVTIDFNEKDCVVISDNGLGCDDLSRMLRQGDHEECARGVGMYGMGGKHAMIWISKHTSIRSVCSGVRRMVFVDWTTLEKKSTWNIDDPDISPAPEVKSGTIITLTKLAQTNPRDKGRMKDLKKMLGLSYAPAIRSGSVQILIRTPKEGLLPVVAPPKPDLTDAVTHDVAIGRGRMATVEMGILSRDDQQNMQGMTIALEGGRVMSARTRIGLGDKPTPGLYGYAVLHPRQAWGVKVLKDGISDKHREELSAAIQRYKPFVELTRLAAERSQNVDIPLDEINQVLGKMAEEIRGHGSAKNRKAKRESPVNPIGTNVSTGDGSPHRRARNTQPGDRFGDGVRKNGIQIQTHQFTEKDKLFDLMGESVVYINTSHLFFRYVNGDMNILVPMAIQFYVSQKTMKGQQVIAFKELLDDKTESQAEQVSGVLECYARTKIKVKQTDEDEATESAM